jgi:hypothetical protein
MSNLTNTCTLYIVYHTTVYKAIKCMGESYII